MTTNLAVLISGSGRTLQNFIDEIAAKRLDARIKVVVSSSTDAGGNEKAKRAKIPVVVVDRKAPDFSDAITKAIDKQEVDLVLLAGFLHLWKFPAKYKGRVLNIHPALLPSFGGKGMYGITYRGGRVGREGIGYRHIADLDYDRRPIVLQRKVKVEPAPTSRRARLRGRVRVTRAVRVAATLSRKSSYFGFRVRSGFGFSQGRTPNPEPRTSALGLGDQDNAG